MMKVTLFGLLVIVALASGQDCDGVDQLLDAQDAAFEGCNWDYECMYSNLGWTNKIDFDAITNDLTAWGAGDFASVAIKACKKEVKKSGGNKDERRSNFVQCFSDKLYNEVIQVCYPPVY